MSLASLGHVSQVELLPVSPTHPATDSLLFPARLLPNMIPPELKIDTRCLTQADTCGDCQVNHRQNPCGSGWAGAVGVGLTKAQRRDWQGRGIVYEILSNRAVFKAAQADEGEKERERASNH